MRNVIIIPTYNERENIEVLIPMIFIEDPDFQVVVVDDNSPDGTAEAVKSLQSKYANLSLIIREKKDGLGKAYVYAFSEVLKKGNVNTIIMMDADLSHDPKHLNEMIKLREKYDVVVGSRYVDDGKTEGWELYRKMLSRLGNLYAKTITRMPVNDCTGGYNAISVEILSGIDLLNLDLSGYAFIMHLKYLLYKSGARFVEIPICFKNRVEGVSKLSNSIIREGILAPWKMVLRN